MNLILKANKFTLAESINEFSCKYHSDYFGVNGLSQHYISTKSKEQAVALASVLRKALCSWGAGRRKAPALKSEDLMTSTLLSEEFFSLMYFFKDRRITDLKNPENGPESGGSQFLNPDSFDAKLISILNILSKEFFTDNTGITYPMKALLLLTGFMPAWDSKVRCGLSLAGFKGTSSSHYPLPSDTNSTLARKLTRLPSYLGDCYNKNQQTFDAAIKGSNYPALISSPGRLFDIILFTQGRTRKIMLALEEPTTKWHTFI